MKNIAVLLHNVRSAHNVGSIFRTCDAAGAAKVYLSGYTPAPIDRFGRPQKDIAKTALGAERGVPWEYHKTSAKLLRDLKQSGYQIVGVEQDRRALDYRTFKPSRPTVFVFGNEVRGLSPSMRDACDVILEIPMRGAVVRQAHHPRHSGRGKESLNVSVAAGIVLFAVNS